MKLGAKIQSVRKEILKITQDELAQRLGVSGGNTISNYEKDLREPEVSILVKIAEMANVSLDWLLNTELELPPIFKESVGERKLASLIETENNLIELPSYPVISSIAAGVGDLKIQEYPEWRGLELQPGKYFWLKVDEEYGFSMRPFLRPKEMVLCAWETKKFNDEDMVAVLWDKTKGAVKILNLNHDIKDIVILHSLNPSERPITLKRSQVTAMYKVVLISKI